MRERLLLSSGAWQAPHFSIVNWSVTGMPASFSLQSAGSRFASLSALPYATTIEEEKMVVASSGESSILRPLTRRKMPRGAGGCQGGAGRWEGSREGKKGVSK